MCGVSRLVVQEVGVKIDLIVTLGPVVLAIGVRTVIGTGVDEEPLIVGAFIPSWRIFQLLDGVSIELIRGIGLHCAIPGISACTRLKFFCLLPPELFCFQLFLRQGNGTKGRHGRVSRNGCCSIVVAVRRA